MKSTLLLIGLIIRYPFHFIQFFKDNKRDYRERPKVKEPNKFSTTYPDNILSFNDWSQHIYKLNNDR